MPVTEHAFSDLAVTVILENQWGAAALMQYDWKPSPTTQDLALNSELQTDDRTAIYEPDRTSTPLFTKQSSGSGHWA